MRQVAMISVDPASVQVVQDLVESSETKPIAAIQNDLIDPVSDAVVDSAIDEKPIVEKPVADISGSVVDSVVENEIDKPVNENDPNPINKYCSCSSATCKCCRDFSIPLIPVRGPGCATIRYLQNDKMSVSIKYGDFTLATRQIDSRKPTPICVPLPGGFNRFCGRVYGISRQDENFKACLGLELRADDEVEASLRVSCFQFGPKGLATMEAEPLPDLESEGEDSDEDDDDDFLGLGAREYRENSWLIYIWAVILSSIIISVAGGGGDDDDDDDEDDDEGGGPGGIVGDVLGKSF